MEGSFESKDLKVNLVKSKVMISGSITQDGLSIGKVDPYGICCLRVKANSVLCVQCVNGIHCRWVRVKMVTPKFSRNFTC